MIDAQVITRLTRFGSLFLDLDKVIYVRRFLPQTGGLRPAQHAGVRVGLVHGEVTLYDDEPGFVELVDWVEQHAILPP